MVKSTIEKPVGEVKAGLALLGINSGCVLQSVNYLRAGKINVKDKCIFTGKTSLNK